MPRRKAQTEEDEIDELVDTLDELEEEGIEDEDEEFVGEDEEEDPDEAPKKTRSRKKRTSKKAAPEKTGVGTAEVAAEAGIEPRALRMYLRSKGIAPGGGDGGGRYNWPSMNSREVQTILKDINKGAVDKLNKEKIADLKSRSTRKKATAKKTTRRKVRTQKR